jgi:superfamily I DNA/RNA helicase
VQLKRAGVPFVVVRDTSIFERAEVQDVLAYIK